MRPALVLKRKVIDLGKKYTSPKITIPNSWLQGYDRVTLKVYNDYIVIRRGWED